MAARDRVIEFAADAADLAVTVKKTSQGFDAEVTVTNKAGHFFPSGVALRRAFLEFKVLDGTGETAKVLWCSGCTNAVGELTAGFGKAVLPSEDPENEHEHHHQVITKETQAQVYEEITKTPEGAYNSSFLGIWKGVKDNRLRPSGFRTSGFIIKAGSSTYDGDRHLKAHGVPHTDKDYYTAKDDTALMLGGGDRLTYQVPVKNAKRVEVTLYYQTLPPRYLRSVFALGEKLGKESRDNNDIKRLYFLMSHLNTGVSKGGKEKSPIADWKLKVKSAAADVR